MTQSSVSPMSLISDKYIFNRIFVSRITAVITSKKNVISKVNNWHMEIIEISFIMNVKNDPVAEIMRSAIAR